MTEENRCTGGEDRNWEEYPEWLEVFTLVRRVISENASRHPGIISEAIVDTLMGTYILTPREVCYRERRKNHTERIRRLAHEVFRILDAGEGQAPVRRITSAVVKAFLLAPRQPDGEGGG